MMAAGRAAELGAKVILLEKNKHLARKLLITGKGRCNITQNQPDSREFVKKIGPKGKFLFSPLDSFGPEKVIAFFEARNLQLKTERGGRVFPVSDRSEDVLHALKKYLEENGVRIACESEVADFELKNNRIKILKLKNGTVQARSYILATGGKSYPLTGSTGDGYQWAKKMGHTIIDPSPALVPVKTKENWVKNLQGLSLKNVAITVFQKNKKQDARFGEMLFTHFGLSGPIILDVSKKIGELLKKGGVTIEIDIKPALDFQQLDDRLQRDFKKNANKNFGNYLPELLPQKMIGTAIELSGIDAGKKIHSITREERKKIIHLLKGMKVTVENLMGYDQAIATSGGVNLIEVDSKTMRSKIIENLFFAGEILDIDGPSGGYNLQICWSTGHAAGTHSITTEKPIT